MKVVMLGTGNAMVTDCYNTCFVIEENGQKFLVDGGGGNGILTQLKKAGIEWSEIRHIFITHKHIDHLLGTIWMTRLICQYMSQGKYQGEAHFYGHEEVIHTLLTICEMVLQPKQVALIGNRVHFHVVNDAEERMILNHKVTFFDLRSTKAKQYGFTMEIGNEKTLVCCGDEPLNAENEAYLAGCEYLMHEAFCLDSQAEIFHPYEKHHSTVKDACILAEKSQIPNLILYHTEDKNIANRKKLYTEEGQAFYHGNLFIPEDLEEIEL